MTRLQGQLEAAMVKASREAQAKNVGLPSKTMERVQKEVVLYSCLFTKVMIENMK